MVTTERILIKARDVVAGDLFLTSVGGHEIGLTISGVITARDLYTTIYVAEVGPQFFGSDDRLMIFSRADLTHRAGPSHGPCTMRHSRPSNVLRRTP